MCSGINKDLDNLKQAYDGMEEMLNHTSKEIVASVPRACNIDLNVIFFPQIGFLISLPKDPETGIVQYEGSGDEGGQWDRIFSSAERVYYKDFRMHDLDATWGDVYATICGTYPSHGYLAEYSLTEIDSEIDIIHDLARDILEYESLLINISDLCGELDW